MFLTHLIVWLTHSDLLICPLSHPFRRTRPCAQIPQIHQALAQGGCTTVSLCFSVCADWFESLACCRDLDRSFHMPEHFSSKRQVIIVYIASHIVVSITATSWRISTTTSTHCRRESTMPRFANCAPTLNRRWHCSHYSCWIATPIVHCHTVVLLIGVTIKVCHRSWCFMHMLTCMCQCRSARDSTWHCRMYRSRPSTRGEYIIHIDTLLYDWFNHISPIT